MQQKFYYFTEPSAIITNNKTKIDIIYCMESKELDYYHFFRLENDSIKSIMERQDCSVGIVINDIVKNENNIVLLKQHRKYNKEIYKDVTKFLANKYENIVDISLVNNLEELLLTCNYKKAKEKIKSL